MSRPKDSAISTSAYSPEAESRNERVERERLFPFEPVLEAAPLARTVDAAAIFGTYSLIGVPSTREEADDGHGI